MDPIDKVNNAASNSGTLSKARFYATAEDLTVLVQRPDFNREINPDEEFFIGTLPSESGEIEIWLDNEADESYYERR